MNKYNDNSRKVHKWTDKKLQAEYKKRAGVPTPDPSAVRMTSLMGAEILRRRKEQYS